MRDAGYQDGNIKLLASRPEMCYIIEKGKAIEAALPLIFRLNFPLEAGSRHYWQ